ncbi:hypothetical protein [Sinomonas albida]|uniref:hypothetical protein n=1 Tax=Sinomonas albida TaxID=369942 RepID=UPI0010A8B9A8|nr:hypothetical protein [Sinomonas albida]
MSANASEQSEFKHGPSVGTVVWGAVVVAIAGLLVSSRLGWFTVDLGVAAVSLLLLAGLGLVVGGTLAASRSRKRIDAAATGDAGGQEPGDTSSSEAAGDASPTDPPKRSPYDAPGPYDGPSL